MITQHVVSFGDEITLTRLPAGRADGYVWLSFVARGTNMPDERGDTWQLRDHLALTWLDGSAADVVADGETGDHMVHLLHLSIRDAGYNTLTIRYVDDGRTISSENVVLPSVAAV